MNEPKEIVEIKNIYAEAGEGDFRVFATLSGTLDGINIYIGGGTDPHIGAVAISTPRPSLADSEKLSCTTSIYNCIGHKDDFVAKMFSEEISVRYNTVTVASAGLHVDDITQEGIQKIKVLSEELLNKVFKELDKFKDKIKNK